MFNYRPGGNAHFQSLLSCVVKPRHPEPPSPPVIPVKPKRNYLGEFPVDVKDTSFANFGPQEWALWWIRQYGLFDGDHHKTWALDQVVRILTGAKIVIVEARWDDGLKELRITLEETPTPEYLEWVRQTNDGEDGPDTYEWDEGTPP